MNVLDGEYFNLQKAAFYISQLKEMVLSKKNNSEQAWNQIT